MARIRTIKPEVFHDKKTGKLSDNAFKVFIGLLIHSDDYGVIERDDDELKAKIYPFDSRTPDTVITAPIDQEIIKVGLVTPFTHDSKDYLHIKNFLKHQRVDKPGRPLLAGWTRATTPRVFAERSQSVPGGLQEDSWREGSKEVGSGSGSRKEGKEGKEGSYAGPGSLTDPAGNDEALNPNIPEHQQLIERAQELNIFIEPGLKVRTIRNMIQTRERFGQIGI